MFSSLKSKQDQDDTAKEISIKIKYIADKLNAQLDERVFEQQQENFKARGGMKSCGGVATFICLSCKIATKLARSMDIRKFVQIIRWTLDYVKANLVPWIMSVGGWLAVLGPRSTTRGWNTVAIFMFGVLTGSAIVYKVMKWH